MNNNSSSSQGVLAGLDSHELNDVLHDVRTIKNSWEPFIVPFLGEHPAFSENPLASKIPIEQKVPNKEDYAGTVFTKVGCSFLVNAVTSIFVNFPTWVPWAGQGFKGFFYRWVATVGAVHFAPYIFNPESIWDRGAKDLIGCQELGGKCDSLKGLIQPIRDKIRVPYLAKLQAGATDMGTLTQKNAEAVVEEFITPEDRALDDGLKKLQKTMNGIQIRSGRDPYTKDSFDVERPCYRGGITRLFRSVVPQLEEIENGVRARLGNSSFHGAISTAPVAPVVSSQAPAVAADIAPAHPATIADQLRQARGAGSDGTRMPLELAQTTDGRHLRDLLGGKGNDVDKKTMTLVH